MRAGGRRSDDPFQEAFTLTPIPLLPHPTGSAAGRSQLGSQIFGTNTRGATGSRAASAVAAARGLESSSRPASALAARPGSTGCSPRSSCARGLQPAARGGPSSAAAAAAHPPGHGALAPPAAAGLAGHVSALGANSHNEMHAHRICR